MKTLPKKRISDSEIKQLVIARLRALPSGRKVSIGSNGEFSKDELIERVTQNDDIGKKIIDIQIKYLQSLKKGVLFPDE